MEENDDTRILAKLEQIRGWLRYHGDYHIKLDLWDLFGCYGITIYHHNTVLQSYIGMHFEKRLDEAMAFLEKENHD